MKTLTLTLLALMFTVSAFAQGQALIPFIEKGTQLALEKAVGMGGEQLIKALEITLKNNTEKYGLAAIRSAEATGNASVRNAAKVELEFAIKTLLADKNVSQKELVNIYKSDARFFGEDSIVAVQMANSMDARMLAKDLGLVNELGKVTAVDATIASEIAANTRGINRDLFNLVSKAIPEGTPATFRRRILSSESLVAKLSNGQTSLGKKCDNVTSAVSAELASYSEGVAAELKRGATNLEAGNRSLKKLVGEERVVSSKEALACKSSAPCSETLNKAFLCI